MDLLLRVDSRDWVTATITVDADPGSAPTVEVALPPTETEPDLWLPAEIVSITEDRPGRWLITYRLLIGTGDPPAHPLPVGDYDWTMRYPDDPARPVRYCGRVTITPAHT